MIVRKPIAGGFAERALKLIFPRPWRISRAQWEAPFAPSDEGRFLTLCQWAERLQAHGPASVTDPAGLPDALYAERLAFCLENSTFASQYGRAPESGAWLAKAVRDGSPMGVAEIHGSRILDTVLVAAVMRGQYEVVSDAPAGNTPS